MVVAPGDWSRPSSASLEEGGGDSGGDIGRAWQEDGMELAEVENDATPGVVETESASIVDVDSGARREMRTISLDDDVVGEE